MIHRPYQAATLSRERFRSWGETQIARCLNRYGIRYLYEHPLAVVDEGKTKIWHPYVEREIM
jgi:hypothetical protein